jgi:hypothetical protein
MHRRRPILRLRKAVSRVIHARLRVLRRRHRRCVLRLVAVVDHAAHRRSAWVLLLRILWLSAAGCSRGLGVLAGLAPPSEVHPYYQHGDDADHG